jgi:hypothetical protein
MQFNDLKEVCKKHDKLLEKATVIQKCNKERHWMKVVTPSSGEFYLDDEEIKLLNDYYEKKGIEIENLIIKLLNK